MQIFAPFVSLEDIAACLDDKRLNKQVLETRQIIRIIEGVRTGYKNHPAVKMYSAHLDFLRLYHNTMRAEWVARGKNSNMPDEVLSVASPKEVIINKEKKIHSSGFLLQVKYPEWWGERHEFHACHRANLLAKDINHYGRFKWTDEPNDEGYWWCVDNQWKFIVKGKKQQKQKSALKRLQTTSLSFSSKNV